MKLESFYLKINMNSLNIDLQVNQIFQLQMKIRLSKKQSFDFKVPYSLNKIISLEFLIIWDVFWLPLDLSHTESGVCQLCIIYQSYCNIKRNILTPNFTKVILVFVFIMIWSEKSFYYLFDGHGFLWEKRFSYHRTNFRTTTNKTLNIFLIIEH